MAKTVSTLCISAELKLNDSNSGNLCKGTEESPHGATHW